MKKITNKVEEAAMLKALGEAMALGAIKASADKAAQVGAYAPREPKWPPGSAWAGKAENKAIVAAIRAKTVEYKLAAEKAAEALAEQAQSIGMGPTRPEGLGPYGSLGPYGNFPTWADTNDAPQAIPDPRTAPKPKAPPPTPMVALANKYRGTSKNPDGTHFLRSQKAQSLRIISECADTPGVSSKGAKDAAYFPQDAGGNVWSKLRGYERGFSEGRKAVFARPCPVRPRHGFVDSRPVKNMAEFESLVVETFAADEQAEIILMQEIVADWSAIATPALITYGPENDGATSGHGSLSIPLVSGSLAPKKMIESIFSGQTNMGALNIKSAPYAEYVHPKDKSKVELVQVRDGPQVKALDHYVPVDMVVRQIVDCTGHDLMKWETLADNLGAPCNKGVLVVHPGGNMASHYAVHCILNKVPVVTSPLAERVKVGDIVKAQGSTPDALTGPELATLGGYITEALEAEYMVGFDIVGQGGRGVVDTLGQFAQFTIAAFHAQGAWGGQDHLLKLRAAGVISLVRLMLSAGVGEMRHFRSNCKAFGPSPLSMSKQIIRHANNAFPGGDQFRTGAIAYGRHECYGAALFLGAEAMEVALHACIRGFFKNWGQTHADGADRRIHVIAGPYIKGPCGYGGPKWGDCMTRAYELLQVARGFATDPTAEAWADLQGVWNNATEAAHNGGALLNKFTSGYGIQNLPYYQGIGLVSPVVAIILGLQGRNHGAK